MKGSTAPAPKWTDDQTAAHQGQRGSAWRIDFEASDGTQREVIAYRVLAGVRIEYRKPSADGTTAELLAGDTLRDLGRVSWGCLLDTLSSQDDTQTALHVKHAGPPPIQLDAAPPPVLQRLPEGVEAKRGLDMLEAGQQLRDLEQKLKAGHIGSAVALSRAFQIGREHEAYLVDQQEQERAARTTEPFERRRAGLVP